jgi:hypothetical protein
MDDSKRVGLDEVRRCLYIAKAHLEDGEKPPADLRGTINNALGHHHWELGLRVNDWMSVHEYVDAITSITEALDAMQ